MFPGPPWVLGRRAVDVLFAEMGRDGDDAAREGAVREGAVREGAVREGEVHRVPMPVRLRESVAAATP
ncbi:hypothetical protein F5972_06050 [Microbispora cellulosiformans]|uniref:Uncharacterized protein n=1 Tax=Microbispora cellulosiformans TaxID=2614688 RepID=A0A5J5KAN2_9ACTN|nr:hypothetical protein [Microbispora cellulosiformans]KAA9380678.1 hypothetical protein F5972_06050 [Microbispora cellulosiformans]